MVDVAAEISSNLRRCVSALFAQAEADAEVRDVLRLYQSVYEDLLAVPVRISVTDTFITDTPLRNHPAQQSESPHC